MTAGWTQTPSGMAPVGCGSHGLPTEGGLLFLCLEVRSPRYTPNVMRVTFIFPLSTLRSSLNPPTDDVEGPASVVAAEQVVVVHDVVQRVQLQAVAPAIPQRPDLLVGVVDGPGVSAE